jgi:CheY-like chemotaxis protein
MHILYIEDEPNDAALVERFVRSTPHRLTIAPTLQAAYHAIQHAPDIVLVDILLGQTRQGFSFINEMRQSGFTKPIIVITGLTMPEDIEACYTCGCNDVLTKPYVITDLARVLTNYLA